MPVTEKATLADGGSINERSRVIYMDGLRAYAIFAVILLHSASPLVYRFGSVGLDWWWAANIFDSAARSSVPLFFMLSGALLLSPSREEPVAVFFRRRMGRVLVPFILWSLVYIFWKAVNRPDTHQWAEAVVRLFFKPAYFHMWFIYVLAGLYLLTPGLRAALKRLDARKMPLDLFILALLAFSAYASASGWAKYFGYAGYLAYYLLGYRIASLDGDRGLAPWAVVIVVSFLAIASGTYYLTASDGGRLNLLFYDFMSPVVVLMSVATFQLFKRLPLNRAGRTYDLIIRPFSRISFGIYLSHVLVMDLLGLAGLDATITHPVVAIPLTAIATAVGAFILIAMLKKMPYVGAVVD